MMKIKEGEKRTFWIGAISGAIGGIFGALSGSRDIFVVGIVGAVMALLVAFGIRGWFKK